MRLPSWARVGCALFAIGWGGNEFTPLLLMYRDLNGYSDAVVDILLGAYVLGIAPGLLVGGPLSDRFGRRPLLLPSPLLAAAGSAILALGAHSVALLFLGRVLSGVGLGIVMAVGTSWVKELSSPPFAPAGDAGAGARRASLFLTIGFGLGAAVAGFAAEWGPWPTVTPYLINIVLLLGSFVLVLPAEETRPSAQGQPGRYGVRDLVQDLRVPSALHRRFMYGVVPMAPWVVGTAASAYAMLPTLMAPAVGDLRLAYSAFMCLVALSCGVAIQPLAKLLDTPRNSMACAVSITVTAVGMLAAALAAVLLNPWFAALAAAILGTAYGLLLVSGLQEVQRIAGPSDLAGLTAVYYSLSYLGFFIPAVLAVAASWFTYPVMFLAGAVIASACLAVIVWAWARHLPEPPGPEVAAGR